MNCLRQSQRMLKLSFEPIGKIAVVSIATANVSVANLISLSANAYTRLDFLDFIMYNFNRRLIYEQCYFEQIN